MESSIVTVVVDATLGVSENVFTHHLSHFFKNCGWFMYIFRTSEFIYVSLKTVMGASSYVTDIRIEII